MTTKLGILGVIIILGASVTVAIIFLTPKETPGDLVFVDGGIQTNEYNSDTLPTVQVPHTNVDDVGLSKSQNFGEWIGRVRRGEVPVYEKTEYTSTPKKVTITTTTQNTEPELVTLDSLNILSIGRGSVMEVPVTKEEDKSKAMLKDFGNLLGEKIQTTVSKNGDQSETLAQFVTKRNIESYNRIRTIGENYIALGNAFVSMPAPEGFKTKTEAVGTGYIAVGKQLVQFEEKTTDTDVYEQILTYNIAVENFGLAFISLAKQFGAFGVTFSPDEPGGIFSPAVSGL